MRNLVKRAIRGVGGGKVGLIQWATSPWGQDVPIHIAFYLIWVSAIARSGVPDRSTPFGSVLRKKPGAFRYTPAPLSRRAFPEKVARHSLAARLFHWIMAARCSRCLSPLSCPRSATVSLGHVSLDRGLVLTASIIFHIIHATFFMDFWSIWPDKDRYRRRGKRRCARHRENPRLRREDSPSILWKTRCIT